MLNRNYANTIIEKKRCVIGRTFDAADAFAWMRSSCRPMFQTTYLPFRGSCKALNLIDNPGLLHKIEGGGTR